MSFFFLFSAKMESLTVRNSTATEENEPKETFIAFARVYSGVVKKGQRLFVLGPKYDPAQFLCMVNSSTNTTVSPQCKKNKIVFYLNFSFLLFSDSKIFYSALRLEELVDQRLETVTTSMFYLQQHPLLIIKGQ